MGLERRLSGKCMYFLLLQFKDPSSVPGTYVRRLMATSNSSFGGVWPLWVPRSSAHRHTQTHTDR